MSIMYIYLTTSILFNFILNIYFDSRSETLKSRTLKSLRVNQSDASCFSRRRGREALAVFPAANDGGTRGSVLKRFKP